MCSTTYCGRVVTTISARTSTIFHVDGDGARGSDFIVRCTSTISVRMKRLGSSNGVPTKKETPSARLHAGCSAGSPGGGSIVSSQHRAGAEGEGLPLDGNCASI